MRLTVSSNSIPEQSRASEDVLIVGGGPAGLSTAWALKQRGIDPLIVESGEAVGWSWQNMPKNITLLSPWKVNSLPGTPVRFCDRHRLHPCREYARYLQEYAHQNSFRIHLNETVNGISPDPEGFKVTSSRSRIHTRNVIVATGYFFRPFIPKFPGQDQTSIIQLHVSSFRSASSLRKVINVDQPKVLVVGKRISAGQLIEELAGDDFEVSLSCRGPIRFAYPPWLLKLSFHLYFLYEDWRVSQSPFFQDDSYPPMEGGKSRELIVSGRIPVLANIKAFGPREISFANGRSESFDAVIYATGFRPVADKILPDDIQSDTIIDMQSVSCPGLFFVGLDRLCSFRSRYLRGIREDALVLAAQVARRLGNTGVSG